MKLTHQEFDGYDLYKPVKDWEPTLIKFALAAITIGFAVIVFDSVIKMIV